MRIDVMVFDSRGKKVASGWTRSPQKRLPLAQRLYDEALRGIVGEKLTTKFLVDGRMSHEVYRRP